MIVGYVCTMEKGAFILHFLQSFIDWKNLGWMFALFSGFGVKIALEITDKLKAGQVIKKTYIIESFCSIFITFVIGFHSRSFVNNFSDNPDIQAGFFALIGVLGYSVFKILYKILTNPKFWEKIVDTLVGIFLSKYAKKQGVTEIKETNNEESPDVRGA